MLYQAKDQNTAATSATLLVSDKQYGQVLRDTLESIEVTSN